MKYGILKMVAASISAVISFMAMIIFKLEIYMANGNSVEKNEMGLKDILAFRYFRKSACKNNKSYYFFL